MSPALYAFLASSGPAGVSRPAVARWAAQHGANPRSVLKDLHRAASRGTLTTRTVAVTIVYVLPGRVEDESHPR